jgi:hypothetical protein
VKIAVKCVACGQRFEGEGNALRALIWPHYESHKSEDYPLSPSGERALFEGEPLVLSCNFGECDFCRKRVLN